MYSATPRSLCPINLAVELLGDQWTLVLLRDMIFADRRHFRELLAGNAEGISPAVLADRLKRMVAAGLLVRDAEAVPGQRASYRLTEKALDLLPVLGALATWSLAHGGADPALAVAGAGLDLAELRARNGLS